MYINFWYPICTAEQLAEENPQRVELLGIRLGMVRQGAADIDLYAEPTTFSQVPEVVPQKIPEVEQTWDWQQQAWIHADIVKAIGLANQQRGAGRGVPGSVVKRIIDVSVDALVSTQRGFVMDAVGHVSLLVARRQGRRFANRRSQAPPHRSGIFRCRPTGATPGP